VLLLLILLLLLLPGGEDVCVEARLVKLGRDVATVEVRLSRPSSGQLVATGEAAGWDEASSSRMLVGRRRRGAGGAYALHNSSVDVDVLSERDRGCAGATAMPAKVLAHAEGVAGSACPASNTAEQCA
jgi:hypothetical protein